jgi:hypothetical protein
MGMKLTDLQINLAPKLEPIKTNDATSIQQPVPTLVNGASAQLKTQIGQTILRTNLNEVLDKFESFKAEIQDSIKDVKLLTEDFKYSGSYENNLRKYSDRSYSNIANRSNNSSSLQTDLFMAAIWEQRHQPELKEKLIDADLKLSDIEKYLDKKLTMCIDEKWLQGRADYIKAFLDDKSGAKAVNELLVEKHSNNNWLLYSASDHYFISESRDILGREVHKSFDQTKDVIELLLNHDAISKKNQQKLSQTLCKTFIEKALSGDMLWNSHSKEYLQEQRSFRDHMIAEVAQNSLSIQGLPINFIKTLNSEDFLSKFIY